MYRELNLNSSFFRSRDNYPRYVCKSRSTTSIMINRIKWIIRLHQAIHPLFMASAFISFGISSIAYRNAVRGITALFRIT